MYCQKCESLMNNSYIGHSKNTVELWACSNEKCDYTFEMRTNARGFHFCFGDDEDMNFNESSRREDKEKLLMQPDTNTQLMNACYW